MIINVIESKSQYNNFVKWNYITMIVHTNIFIELYIEEELTENDILIINKGDAVLSRRPSKGLQKKILVPIFSQNENPLSYKNKLYDGIVYLTDKLFIDFFSKAYQLPNYCVKFKGNSAVLRDIDILYIGSDRGGFSVKSSVPFFLSYFLKNSFDSIFIYNRVKSLVANCIKKNKWIDAFPLFFQSINQSIRNHRRRHIHKQLGDMSKKGINITAFGSKELDIETINYNCHMDYSNIEHYFLRSKIVVCTTPNHLSMLNERFVTAIYYGAIPIVEPYPQYKVKSGIHKFFQYNYKEISFSNKCLEILANYENSSDLYERYSKEIEEKYSIDKYQKLFKFILSKVKSEKII